MEIPWEKDSNSHSTGQRRAHAATLAAQRPRRTAETRRFHQAGFGKRQAAARKALGLSQQQFAGKLGTTRVNFAHYERKAGNPTLDFIHRCAELLNMPVSEFIREDDGSGRR